MTLLNVVIYVAGVDCPGSLGAFKVRFIVGVPFGRASIPRFAWSMTRYSSELTPYPYSWSEVITQTKIVEFRSVHDDQIEPAFKHRILAQHY